MWHKVGKLITNYGWWLLAYVITALGSMVLPRFGPSPIVANLAQTATDGVTLMGGASTHLKTLNLCCFAATFILAWGRGRHIQRTWIAAFPLLAAAFTFTPVIQELPFLVGGTYFLGMLLGFKRAQKPVN